jgi:methylthioribose-1-phosphate isomerase
MDNIRLSPDSKSVFIIDQTLLPNEEKEVELKAIDEMVEAISSLRVRGAPAIGICAAHCLCALSFGIKSKSKEGFISALKRYASLLNATRPTAVNLSWALKRMLDKAHLAPFDEIRSALKDECQAIYNEDVAMCLAISESGLTLLKDGDGILTHCNAGPLATSRYGTALGPILLGHERGMRLRVFADETRPLLQGARLTMHELMKAGVDATLLCDNMAASAMKKGWISKVFVGCDRIAANGDAANKIGTMGVAILAKHFGIPFYVLGPSSTLDLSCADGAGIEIEERDPEEISVKHYAKPMAPVGAKCFNPAFDVTDHSLISGIITEKGIFRPPYGFACAQA